MEVTALKPGPSSCWLINVNVGVLCSPGLAPGPTAAPSLSSAQCPLFSPVSQATTSCTDLGLLISSGTGGPQVPQSVRPQPGMRTGERLML